MRFQTRTAKGIVGSLLLGFVYFTAAMPSPAFALTAPAAPQTRSNVVNIDATLGTATIRSLTVDSLGTPAATIAGAIPGETKISDVLGAETNGSDQSTFTPHNVSATVRVVKYPAGTSNYSSFGTDAVFSNTDPIADHDIFVVEVTAPDSSKLYYQILVRVLIGAPSQYIYPVGALESASISDVTINVVNEYDYYDLNTIDPFYFLINQSAMSNGVTHIVPAEPGAQAIVKRFPINTIVDQLTFDSAPVDTSSPIQDGDIFVVQVSEPNSWPINSYMYYEFVAVEYSADIPTFTNTPIGSINTQNVVINNLSSVTPYSLTMGASTFDSSTSVPINPYTSNNTDFSFYVDGCNQGGDSFGSNCTIAVNFTPSIIAQETTTLRLVDYFGNSEPITLTGLGLTAPHGGLVAPSFSQASLQILVDNDFAVFLGNSSGVRRLFYDNTVGWPGQVSAASTLQIASNNGETYLYILAMGGGGSQENIGGYINGIDIGNFPGAQVLIDTSSPLNGDGSVPYFNVADSITGYVDPLSPDSNGFVADGTFTDTSFVQDIQNVIKVAPWGSAVSGDPGVPQWVGSGDAVVGPQLNGHAWAFPTAHAVLFRYPLSSAGLPTLPDDQKVTLNWTPATGGTHASAYYVYYKVSGQSDANYNRFGPVAGTTATITGLENGTLYTFAVAGTNPQGDISPLSVTADCAPFGPVHLRAPDPVQQSVINSISPTVGPEEIATPITISGSFIENVLALTINGVPLPPGSWHQTPTSITFTMPANVSGPYSIQLYNGAAPILAPQFFTFVKAIAVETITATAPVAPAVATPVAPVVTNQNKPQEQQSSDKAPDLAPVKTGPLNKNLSLNIYFEMASYKVLGANLKKLESLAKKISGLGTSITITVTGFAQPTPGSEATDGLLSKRRAAAVAKILRSFGVTTKLQYLGAGRTTVNDPTSRYVEIVAANN